MPDISPRAQAEEVLASLDKALSAGDIEAVSALFQEECYWRDLVTFTWNIATMEGRSAIEEMLRAQLAATKPSNWRLSEGEEVTAPDGVIHAWIDFDTEVARGHGHLRLKNGKIFTLLTSMTELKGFEEPTGDRRPLGATFGAGQGVVTWKGQREKELAELGYTVQPHTLIIGGGQGGIALGARLRQQGVPTIIIEKNARAGDSWRKRYKSLCLHDPVWYDHLPYLPFPPNWPIFSPKDKIGDWLEMYTKVMELNYWTSTACKSASFDDKTKKWTVVVDRDGEELVLQPSELVLATGMSGKAHIPQFKGMERFKGEQHHSSRHPGPDAYQGKKVVVIGSNNSAHDICAALCENGADVTMVQRTSTLVVKSDTLHEYATGQIYSEKALRAGISTEKADMINASVPYALMAGMQKPLYDQMRAQDADHYERLEKAGFMLDWGEDESGLFMKYMRRGSGYYIDIGASDMVADGKIKLKSGHEVREITEGSVILEDSSELAADLIVYATGYGSMNGWAADLIGQDVADKVGKVWGLGSDTAKDPGPWVGEPRNMWKPTRQQALWFHGGNLHQSRHNSHYLALQLKARMEGIPTPVYGIPETYHKS